MSDERRWGARPPTGQPTGRPVGQPIGQPIGPLTAAAAAAREEWRAEQETAIADAAEAFEHGRTVHELLTESMRRGDRVALTVGPHRHVGMIVEVASDCVGIRNVGSGRVDVQLRSESPWQVVVQEREVGQPAGDEVRSGSFRARLLDREAAGDEVTIGSVLTAEPIDGKLVVGADHVRVVGRGGGETVVPMQTLAYVAPRRD
jgi:hypothetical protein